MADFQKPRRWIVQEPCTLRSVIERMPPSGNALDDGRVFVDRKRWSDADRRLRPGSVVDVFPAQPPGRSAVEVLSRRGNLIAVAKPAGWSTIPDQRGTAASLRDEVARAVNIHPAQRVHATSRLDRLVSGVVIFALDEDARTSMQRARQAGAYRRHYVAMATHPPTPHEGWVDAPIGRGRRATDRRVDGARAVPARTRYAVLSEAEGLTLVAAEPQTGRTHQIRVHMAHVGAPLVGDHRYGDTKPWVSRSGAVVRLDRIGLHAAWVEVPLPDGTLWRIDAPIPTALQELWSRAGGAESAWNLALRPLETSTPSTLGTKRGTLDHGERR